MKKFPALKWSLRLLTPGFVAVVFTGCFGVIPSPYSPHVDYGQKLRSSQTRFIEPGRTTRKEVIATLGPNCVTFPRTSSIAYTWEFSGGGGFWWSTILNGKIEIFEGGSWPGGWRGFLVAFDEQDVVRAAAFKRLSYSRSLDENMELWVAHLPGLPTPVLTVGR